MSKGTPIRNIRVPDELWNKAQDKAADRGESLSHVLRESLEAYTKQGDQVNDLDRPA